MNFIKDMLFKYWNIFELIVALLGFASLAIEELSSKYKILFIVAGVTFAFIIKLIIQSYDYYQNYNRPLKVKGSIKGEAAYKGFILIKIEPIDYIRQYNLLTLYCKGTSILQPICILEIIQCEKGEDIIAIQKIPSPEYLNITNYLNEESRSNSLYVKPFLSTNEIDRIKQNSQHNE